MEDHASDVVKVCLPFSSINKFIDKQFENSRLLAEGESVYEAKHVVVCSVKNQKDDEVTLAALVLQTSAISKDPHELEVSIKGREVAAASCTCKAGQHKCKHVVALLLHINARETFSVLSATDLPQQWGKAQKAGVEEKYQPRKIVDLPNSKRAKKEHVQLPEGDILKRLLHGLPYIPSALSHSERRSAHASTSTASCSLSETSCTTAKETCCQAQQEQIPSTETDVVLARSTLPMIIPDDGKSAVAGASSAEDAHVQACSTRPPTIAEAAKAAVAAGALSTEDMYMYIQTTFKNDAIKDITNITQQQANSPLWMKYRQAMITASIAYKVYTRVNTVKTKMGPHDMRPLLKTVMREQNVQTSAMKRGALLEEAAKKVYIVAQSFHKNLQVKKSGLLIMAEHPCIGASPDGIVTCDCCSSRVLEVKCPVSLDKFQAKETTKDEPLCLKKTSKHFCQVQVQMALAELMSADVFVFQDSTNFLLFSVMFDQSFFQAVVDRAVYFFKSYVLPHITK